MTAIRQGISLKTRFEILSRDHFTCQYCGRRPPDIVLEVDHIEAVANGGTNESLNLVTSCSDCNRGKSATRLATFDTVKEIVKAGIENLGLSEAERIVYLIWVSISLVYDEMINSSSPEDISTYIRSEATDCINHNEKLFQNHCSAPPDSTDQPTPSINEPLSRAGEVNGTN